MAHEHDITFGAFRLEMSHGGLWRGAQSIALRPALAGDAALFGRAS
jgi:hypothetical protein